MSTLDLSFEEIRNALDGKKISSLELVQESLVRAHTANANLNAYISFCDDTALAQARDADTRLARDEVTPTLGIPLAVKDLILTVDQVTTAGSKMLKDFVSPYDATVVAKLKQAGTPLVGKTNLDEFAMGSSNENSYFGACKNPWDLTRVPGGSSGGSAAAVAARTVTLSLGTDTGGSIRQPASLTGITGLKPTYGRVSRYGVVAYASSLDQVGPMCTDALGCAAVLEVISGHDRHDATSSPMAVPAFFRATQEFRDQGKIRGLRIGIPQEYFGEGLDPGVRKSVENALEHLKGMGAQLVSIQLPHTEYSLSAYYMIATAEASSNLARYDGIHYGHRSSQAPAGDLDALYAYSRGEGFGPEVRTRILLGTYALSSGYYDAYYKKAAQVRALIKNDFTEAFKKCDVIAGPTSPTTAFKIGEKSNNTLAMYLADVYTLATNLAALPGISFNVGFDSGLPVGLQLMSPWWQETVLLGMAATYQREFKETLRKPGGHT